MLTQSDPAVKNQEKTKKHLEFLHEKVFQTKKKWPHFNRLLTDVQDLASQTKKDQTVICLERAYIYGGDSLFAPLFTQGKFISIDCQTETAAQRGAYQKEWLEDSRCIHIKANLKQPITNTNLPDESADILMIPNVVHHVRNQDAMFAECARLLKKGGIGYIFEALLRELHQIPDDYVRFTPWGFETMLEKHGLKMTQWKPAGGAFEAIAYCWVQALQYFPPEERKEKENWFYNHHFPELMELNSKYPENQIRKHTSFPVGYSIYFTKI